MPEKADPLPQETQISTEGGKKASWVSVASIKPTLSQHMVDVSIVDGSEVVEIPDEVIQNSVPLWETSLKIVSLAMRPTLRRSMLLLTRYGL